MVLRWKKFITERSLLTALFVGGLLWIFGAFFINLSFPDTSYSFLGATKKAKLDSGKPVTQVFTAKADHLNQIKIIVDDIDLRLREKIVFELADAFCETTLARDTMTLFTPKPHIYYHFNFPAIPDSAGQTYCFRVAYFSPFEGDYDRPYLGASEGEQFAGWSYFNEGNNRIYEDRTLQMRPAYGSGSLLNDLEQLNNRLSQYKPEFLKGTPLTLIFGILLIGTLILIFQIIRSKNE